MYGRGLMNGLGLCGLCLSLMACQNLSEEERIFNSGSATMVTKATHQDVDADGVVDLAMLVYTVNVDEGTVTSFDSVTGEVLFEIEVGGEPTRIARAGERLFVTLRNQQGLAVLSTGSQGEMSIDAVLSTGVEPYGVVASQDGERVFVANSMDNRVDELDPNTLEWLRSFEVSGMPKWLAIHPSGKALYVGSQHGDSIHVVDLKQGSVRLMSLPQIDSFTTDETGANRTIELTERVTGDMAVTPDGKALGIPALYVNNTTGAQLQNGLPVFPYYTGAGVSLSRFNPVVVTVPLGGDGGIEAKKSSAGLAIGFAGSAEASSLRRSYVSSLTATPDSLAFVGTMESSNSVFLYPTYNTGRSAADREIEVRHTTNFETEGVGPRGVVFTGNEQAFVHSFLDRSISDLNYNVGRLDLKNVIQEQGRTVSFWANRDLLRTGAEHHQPLTASMGELTLSEQGRRLFYSAVDTDLMAEGGGVSCSTCHFDNGVDGISWQLPSGRRNTPYLAGGFEGTHRPVTWTDEDIETVAEEAIDTVNERMGGSGVDGAKAYLLGEFIEGMRVVNPTVEADSMAALRGKAIFESEETGCAGCHNGPLLTDGYDTDMLTSNGQMLRTRALVGLGASAPYLHNGSVNTLEDLVELAPYIGMGNTTHLSDNEVADLVAYLKSL